MREASERSRKSSRPMYVRGFHCDCARTVPRGITFIDGIVIDCVIDHVMRGRSTKIRGIIIPRASLSAR